MSKSIKSWPSESRKTAKNLYFFCNFLFSVCRHEQQRKTGPTHTHVQKRKDIRPKLNVCFSFSLLTEIKRKEALLHGWLCLSVSSVSSTQLLYATDVSITFVRGFYPPFFFRFPSSCFSFSSIAATPLGKPGGWFQKQWGQYLSKDLWLDILAAFPSRRK